jgi:hypothetical protein
MAMVPPVAKNSTTGLVSSANADAAIRQARPDSMAANLLRIDRLSSRALPAGTRSDWTIGNFPVLRQQIQHCGPSGEEEPSK